MTKTATLIVEFEYDDEYFDIRRLERYVGIRFEGLFTPIHIEVAAGDMEQAFGVKKP